MRIDVTAEDIATGQPGRECHCPIARALARAFPAATRISVWPSDSDVFEGDAPYITIQGDASLKLALPAEANSFALRFDGGNAVEPFSFDLDVTP